MSIRWHTPRFRGPISALLGFIGIGALSILLTVVLPGAIAYSGKSFYGADIERRLPVEAARTLRAYQQKRKDLQDELDLLHKLLGARLAAGAAGSEIANLTDASRRIADDMKELQSAPPAISITGFYLSPQMLLWPGIYTSLLCLLSLARPPHVSRFSVRETW